MGKPGAVITLEEVVALNPDFVVVCCCGLSLASASREMTQLERKKHWMLLEAVIANRVYVVDGDR